MVEIRSVLRTAKRPLLILFGVEAEVYTHRESPPDSRPTSKHDVIWVGRFFAQEMTFQQLDALTSHDAANEYEPTVPAPAKPTKEAVDAEFEAIKTALRAGQPAPPKPGPLKPDITASIPDILDSFARQLAEIFAAPLRRFVEGSELTDDMSFGAMKRTVPHTVATRAVRGYHANLGVYMLMLRLGSRWNMLLCIQEHTSHFSRNECSSAYASHTCCGLGLFESPVWLSRLDSERNLRTMCFALLADESVVFDMVDYAFFDDVELALLGKSEGRYCPLPFSSPSHAPVQQAKAS